LQNYLSSFYKTSKNLENYFNSVSSKSGSTAEKILLSLKIKGAQSAKTLAKELNITNEGARLQLLKLAEQGLIKSSSSSGNVGRPVVLYSLTEKGLSHFPDAHQDLTVQLLESIKGLLGNNALESILSEREKKLGKRYAAEINPASSLEKKLSDLAKIKTEEGYMAEWRKKKDGYFFIENHCPICRAAKHSRSLCGGEMNSFKKALGRNIKVERVENIVEGSERCIYKITV
jgi:predicted ArsR family transcriptional regulator